MACPFAPQLARLDAGIEREIIRLRARYQLSLDEFRGLYVSDEQVDQLLRDAATSDVTASPRTDQRLATGASDNPRWRRLVDVFRLTPVEEDLLFIAAAPEFDLKYETLYAYLNDDVVRKWPTADLARRLLTGCDDLGTVVGALAPCATLAACHLVQRVAALAGRVAVLNAGYALASGVGHWLHGHSAFLVLENAAIDWLPGVSLPDCSDAVRRRAEPIARLVDVAAARGEIPPVIALLGDAGSGRTSTALAIAAATGWPFVCVHLQSLGADDDVAEVFDRLTLALTIEPAVVLVDGFEALVEDEQRRGRRESQIARAISRWPSPVLVLFRTADEERWRTCVGARRVIEMRCHQETFAGRVALWKQAARGVAADLADPELESLAGRFALTPGQVRAAFATARDLAAMDGTDYVAADRIGAAARLTSDRALGRLATKVERMHDWSDLVLPSATLRRLRELAAAIKDRELVYGQWGFGDRVITGIGIKALFAGASGTGKTMAAGVIARELDLDLYKIDLSGVVSKYIGETEKNLDRIFRAARAANGIVFLDEAEAIMGKRSEVKDAHDRYANIEVAYLLQKLEEHDGIVILATNLKRNIDDAFNRRMQYVIDFPRPDEAERERIWRGMFPPRSPLGEDVDFAFLARHFDLAGGDIRNVVLDAAFLAARDGGVIGMSAIVEALARQLAKQGKTPTGTDFRQYQRLLPKAGC
jgi:AAA+ superfamily predicted ATPase